jgi:hypothetical protein
MEDTGYDDELDELEEQMEQTSIETNMKNVKKEFKKPKVYYEESDETENDNFEYEDLEKVQESINNKIKIPGEKINIIKKVPINKTLLLVLKMDFINI